MRAREGRLAPALGVDRVQCSFLKCRRRPDLDPESTPNIHRLPVRDSFCRCNIGELSFVPKGKLQSLHLEPIVNLIAFATSLHCKTRARPDEMRLSS